MSTDALVSWLRGVLDDEERVARATADHRQRRGEYEWLRVDVTGMPSLVGDALGNVITFGGVGGLLPEQAEHIARHDPARVLRQVEAYRRVLQRHAPMGASGYCEWCPNNDSREVTWPCPDVLDVASVCSDHPGYREDWRP